jgi:UDP-glucose 4-epimerase
MKKNILVTGGAGFIGSHLVDYLVKKRYNVTVIDNFFSGSEKNLFESYNKIKIINCDISNFKLLEKNFKKFDIVYHLAAKADIVPSINFPLDYFNSNVVGTINLLELSKRFRVKKFVYAASASCYGLPDNIPTKENSKLSPQYPYALTKLMGEDLCLHWEKVYKLKTISLRFFNVYGPRSRTSGAYGAVFGVFLAQKIKNKPLTVVGDGNQTRDFIFVSDLVEALYKAGIGKSHNIVINLGSGKETAVNKIAALIGGKKVYIPKRPGEPDRTIANINLAKKMLKWKPVIKIEDGVKLLLKNIHYWSTAPVWTPKKINSATKTWFKFLK